MQLPIYRHPITHNVSMQSFSIRVVVRKGGTGWSAFFSFLDLSFSVCLFSLSPSSCSVLTAVLKKKMFLETSSWDKPLFCQKTTLGYFTEEGKLIVFYRALFQLCLGCLIKCSFPLVVECVSAFCRPVPWCLLQSTHMVCLSVYDFSYTGVVRFLNHLSTRGRAVHI